MVLGLALAKRMRDMAENILLVAASKESYLVNEGDRETTWLLDFADGASAVVVSNGYKRNMVLESSFISDGRFHGAVVVKDFGAIRLAEKGYTASPRFESIVGKDVLKRELGPRSREAFNRVIREAVELSGYSVRDIDLLVVNHMKRSFHYRLVEDLGISPEKAPYLEDYGHTQSSDMIIGLDIGVRRGLVGEGSLIVFASGGTGFLWGATALRWG
jgi:3-oxoacyl-[acyl-carrier-protein] synthase-3